MGLGSIGAEGDVARSGPVFKKWYESYYLPRNPGSRIPARDRDEFRCIVTCLDALAARRLLELGDYMSSRLRMLSVGCETGHWRIAKEFLSYETRDEPLVKPAMMDVAVELAAKRNKRERDIARVGAGGAGAAGR